MQPVRGSDLPSLRRVESQQLMLKGVERIRAVRRAPIPGAYQLSGLVTVSEAGTLGTCGSSVLAVDGGCAIA